MLTNDELLIETAKSNLPVILSTGMSSLDEVDNAVNLLKSIQVICNNALQPPHTLRKRRAKHKYNQNFY